MRRKINEVETPHLMSGLMGDVLGNIHDTIDGMAPKLDAIMRGLFDEIKGHCLPNFLKTCQRKYQLKQDEAELLNMVLPMLFNFDFLRSLVNDIHAVMSQIQTRSLPQTQARPQNQVRQKRGSRRPVR